jgi:hypothetical protein
MVALMKTSRRIQRRPMEVFSDMLSDEAHGMGERLKRWQPPGGGARGTQGEGWNYGESSQKGESPEACQPRPCCALFFIATCEASRAPWRTGQHPEWF